MVTNDVVLIHTKYRSSIYQCVSRSRLAKLAKSLNKATLNLKRINIMLNPMLVQGIFAKIGPDLELRGGDLISSPADSIVSLISPKKIPVGKNYFSATPFFTFSQTCNRWPYNA